MLAVAERRQRPPAQRREPSAKDRQHRANGHTDRGECLGVERDRVRGEHRGGDQEQQKRAQHPAIHHIAQQQIQRQQADREDKPVVALHERLRVGDCLAHEPERRGKQRANQRIFDGGDAMTLEKLRERGETWRAIATKVVREEQEQFEKRQHQQQRIEPGAAVSWRDGRIRRVGVSWLRGRPGGCAFIGHVIGHWR